MLDAADAITGISQIISLLIVNLRRKNTDKILLYYAFNRKKLLHLYVHVGVAIGCIWIKAVKLSAAGMVCRALKLGQMSKAIKRKKKEKRLRTGRTKRGKSAKALQATQY